MVGPVGNRRGGSLGRRQQHGRGRGAADWRHHHQHHAGSAHCLRWAVRHSDFQRRRQPDHCHGGGDRGPGRRPQPGPGGPGLLRSGGDPPAPSGGRAATAVREAARGRCPQGHPHGHPHAHVGGHRGRQVRDSPGRGDAAQPIRDLSCGPAGRAHRQRLEATAAGRRQLGPGACRGRIQPPCGLRGRDGGHVRQDRPPGFPRHRRLRGPRPGVALLLE